MWQIHTMPRIMHGIYIAFLSIIKNPNPISSVTLDMIVAFVCKVIPFFLTKDSRCFLYIFVPVNHLCSFSDEFAKQNTVTRKNGTVGKIGSAMPIQPSARQMQPKAINNAFLIFTIDSPFFFISLFFRALQYKCRLQSAWWIPCEKQEQLFCPDALHIRI